MRPLKQEFEYWDHPFECLFKKFVCIMANYKSVDTVVAQLRCDSHARTKSNNQLCLDSWAPIPNSSSSPYFHFPD